VGITHGNYRKTVSNKYNVIIEPYNALAYTHLSIHIHMQSGIS